MVMIISCVVAGVSPLYPRKKKCTNRWHILAEPSHPAGNLLPREKERKRKGTGKRKGKDKEKGKERKEKGKERKE